MIIIKAPGIGTREFEHSVRIGRDKAWAEVPLDQTAVSRYHAAVVHKGNGRFFIQDMGSTNGTKVNSESITETELKNGDLIRIGNAIVEFEIVELPG